jgi:CubicO group peptidase (beta-lactamase class C family)
MPGYRRNRARCCRCISKAARSHYGGLVALPNVPHRRPHPSKSATRKEGHGLLPVGRRASANFRRAFDSAKPVPDLAHAQDRLRASSGSKFGAVFYHRGLEYFHSLDGWPMPFRCVDRQPSYALYSESMLRNFALLCLPGMVLVGAAQPLPVDGVNPAILSTIPVRMQEFINGKTVAGAVSVVARGNEILEFDALGMADIEAARPMRKDTIFQIMSMTKPVTAIGIMMLAEEGKLTVRDPVEQYLPEFRGVQVASNAGPDASRLRTPDHAFTIRDLMTHTAGIVDPAPAEISSYPQTLNLPLAEVVRHLARQPLLFQPGTQWSYSSPGIEILGRIIEVCSGQKYEDFIAERILKPLGMKDSFFFPPEDKISRIAMVYAGASGRLVRAPGSILGGDPAKYRKGAVFPAPGWGLYSTAEDLLHVYRMMLGNGVYEGKRYLSPYSVHLMTEAHTTGIHPVGWMRGSDYGLAWEVVTNPFGELAGHSMGSYGHGGAFGTQGWIDPGNGLISVLLIQRSDGGTDTMVRTFLGMAEAAVADKGHSRSEKN